MNSIREKIRKYFKHRQRDYLVQIYKKCAQSDYKKVFIFGADCSLNEPLNKIKIDALTIRKRGKGEQWLRKSTITFSVEKKNYFRTTQQIIAQLERCAV